ncbi:hypothetical protein E1B28_012034 [Marasmius oreades]|uniref:Uncharacterized protein n=1 Tax=Marasmius oreades TaxID=181124 RepID=A0A9P7UNI4_9AGAR|nr:uncharacterized protein E1B28_012034 [Marasmius oreades]KAG7087995.1 hypothetical protein E1B28_012034 [Marasmius oreades]
MTMHDGIGVEDTNLQSSIHLLRRRNRKLNVQCSTVGWADACLQDHWPRYPIQGPALSALAVCSVKALGENDANGRLALVPIESCLYMLHG